MSKWLYISFGEDSSHSTMPYLYLRETHVTPESLRVARLVIFTLPIFFLDSLTLKSNEFQFWPDLNDIKES